MNVLNCQCPGCGRDLEYASEDGEKEIQCPLCAVAFTLPPAPEASVQTEAWAASSSWARPPVMPRSAAAAARLRHSPKKQSAWPWRDAIMIGGAVIALLVVASFTSGTEMAWSMVGLLGMLLLGGIIYFIPSILAAQRSHRNATGVLLVNLFLGWTVLGWVGALVWAVYEDKR